MSENLLKKIKADIEKTGFITELLVGDMLNQNKWHVSHSVSYEDMQSLKSREIDVVSTKNFHSKKTNLYTEFHLVVEVKKIKKNPWVVFTTPFVFKSWGWRILHSGWNYTNKKSAILSSDAFEEKHPFKKKKRFGKAFHEAFKTINPGVNSKIFDAILSVCKAAYHLKKSHGGEPFKNDFDPKKSVELHFYLPVIVLDGQLFEAYLDEGEISVKEQSWVPIEYEISSEKFKHGKNTFFPSIVKLEAFDEYIQQIETWINTTNQNLNNELLKILKT